MKIGVMLPNWIGDVAMATPALRALRRHFGPRAQITGILRPYVAEVLAGTTWLNETLSYDHRAQDPRLRTWQVTWELRRRTFDLILLLSNSFRTGLVAWLAGGKERIGYARNGRGPLLSRSLAPPRDKGALRPISAVDYYLQLAYAIGCPQESPRLELATTAKDERAADRVWRELGLSKAEQVVILNTGAAAGSAKQWPTEYFTELACRMVSRSDAWVLIVCGPAERDAAAQIERGASHPRVKSLAGYELSIGLTKACTRRSQLVVTTDSGPRHIAAAFSVPAVSLFGPTDPRWADNYHPDETRLRLDLPCSPCGKKACPLGHQRCMRDLTVEQVLAAVEKRLAKPAVMSAA
jgi:heptosyltransferase-2